MRAAAQFESVYSKDAVPDDVPAADRAALRDAVARGYLAGFRAIMLAFVVATLLVPFMRKVAPPKTPAPAGH